jgi:hypothetical protein
MFLLGGPFATNPSTFFSAPARVALAIFLSLTTTQVSHSGSPQLLDSNSQRIYESAHPYLEEPLEELVERIPDLKGIHPAPDQVLLPTILSNTGRATEAYFDNLVDLVAHERIDQEKLNAKGAVKQKQQTQYNYLILVHRDELPPKLEEYRTDSRGNNQEQTGRSGGFSVTSGFALICVHFLPEYRSDSTFKYLGDQVVDSRPTYVVAFAQRPERAIAINHVSDEGFFSVPLLVQGIVWIDRENFQIIRIRTDLLAPRTDVGLTVQSTEVTFREVRLPDVASGLWLPRKVSVASEYRGQSFRNEHQYSDYQRFRVSTRIVP